ncbi:hypothetical protein CIPAW_08G126900 [Carya illinoinensis]|uniref:Uncharacterized protein n=1 Tax=Carya illinoinensis TaxID=32201 RepID=A0A8T1PYY3_CARIL|nr:hypothetical protein CIPAW_08G126900 [Carya illinoinensis]
MGASSHIINLVRRNNLASALCLLTLHVLFLLVSKGILKRKCVVRPPSKIDAVTPDEIIANATNCLDLTVARSALYRNVFPIPPGPSTKSVAISF